MRQVDVRTANTELNNQLIADLRRRRSERQRDDRKFDPDSEPVALRFTATVRAARRPVLAVLAACVVALPAHARQDAKGGGPCMLATTGSALAVTWTNIPYQQTEDVKSIWTVDLSCSNGSAGPCAFGWHFYLFEYYSVPKTWNLNGSVFGSGALGCNTPTTAWSTATYDWGQQTCGAYQILASAVGTGSNGGFYTGLDIYFTVQWST